MMEAKIKRKLRVNAPTIVQPPTPPTTSLQPLGYYTMNGGSYVNPDPGTVINNYANLKSIMSVSSDKLIIWDGTINGNGTIDFGFYGQGRKTILGKNTAVANGFGMWWWNNLSNIVVRNITFDNMPNFPDGQSKRDFLQFRYGISKVLIDHCTFNYTLGLDGMIDVLVASDFVSLTHNKLIGSSRPLGIGGQNLPEEYVQDVNKLRVTMAFNHIINCLERGPSYGVGKRMHCINDLHEFIDGYDGAGTYKGYGVGSRRGAIVRTDGVIFMRSGNPLASIDDGDGHGGGQFSGIATNAYLGGGSNKLLGLPEAPWTHEYDISGILKPVDPANVQATAQWIRDNAGAGKLTMAQMGYPNL